MNTHNEADEIRSKYDFSAGVRGKHHKAYTQDTNVVVLKPDVAAVNHALRLLMEIADKEVGNKTTTLGQCDHRSQVR